MGIKKQEIMKKDEECTRCWFSDLGEDYCKECLEQQAAKKAQKKKECAEVFIIKLKDGYYKDIFSILDMKPTTSKDKKEAYKFRTRKHAELYVREFNQMGYKAEIEEME